MKSATNQTYTPIRFAPKEGREFEQTLKKRVRQYFKDNGISKNGDFSNVLKSIVMLSIYFVPYFLMIFGVITNPWLIILSWAVMGFGMAGIGMSIMHDANHGSLTKNEKSNFYIGKIISILGGNSINWRIQHNVLHHSYTNVTGYDEDIDSPVPLLRFTPRIKRRSVHKYQYLYAWFFYGLLTLAWVVMKDFLQLYRYKSKGLTKIEDENFGKLLAELIIFKIFYYVYVIVVPLLVIDAAWWVVVLGIVTMHFVAGLVLSVIFQLAHVVPDAAFPEVEEGPSVNENWSIHQLKTTANFAPNNKLLSWYVGGLNFQVEHHLFPNICHIHYPKISEIVRSTAKEFGVPYYQEPTFFSAIRSHAQMLKQLGQA